MLQKSKGQVGKEQGSGWIKEQGYDRSRAKFMLGKSRVQVG